MEGIREKETSTVFYILGGVDMEFGSRRVEVDVQKGIEERQLIRNQLTLFPQGMIRKEFFMALAEIILENSFFITSVPITFCRS